VLGEDQPDLRLSIEDHGGRPGAGGHPGQQLGGDPAGAVPRADRGGVGHHRGHQPERHGVLLAVRRPADGAPGRRRTDRQPLVGAGFRRPEHVHYAATKGGITLLTKGLAVELAGAGITVTAIAPGAIALGDTVTIEDGPALHRHLSARVPGRDHGIGTAIHPGTTAALGLGIDTAIPAAPGHRARCLTSRTYNRMVVSMPFAPSDLDRAVLERAGLVTRARVGRPD
jgi:hypothetical protein